MATIVMDKFFKPFANQLIGTATNALTSKILSPIQKTLGLQTPSGQGSFLGLSPNQLVGGGLLLGSAALDKEPGEVGEARQSVRNLLTPESQTGQFTSYVKGLSDQFQPLLTQQRQRGIEDIGARFRAAFPSTVGAQGSEFGTLARYITDEALPREQDLLGRLGLQGIQNQLAAGRTLLDSNQENGLAQALGQLGGYSLLRDLYGAGTQQSFPGTDGAQLLDQSGRPLGTVNQTTGQLLSSLPPEIARQLMSQLLASGIGAEAGVGMGLAGGAGVGIGAGASAGVGAGISGGAGVGGGAIGGLATGTGVATPGIAASTGLDFGLAGPGLLGPSGFGSTTAVLSSVGSGAVGYAIGNAIGKRFASPESTASGVKAGLGGAAGGAAAGFAVGGPVGALIGAVLGGIGGIFGERTERHERKEGQIEAEAQQTAALRPQAIASANDLFTQSEQAQQIFNSNLRERVETGVDVLIASGDPGIQQLLTEARQQFNPTLGSTAGFDDSLAGWQSAGRALNGKFIGALLAGQLGAGRGFNPQALQTEASGFQSSETGKFNPAMTQLAQFGQRFSSAQDFTNRLLSYLQSKGL